MHTSFVTGIVRSCVNVKVGAFQCLMLGGKTEELEFFLHKLLIKIAFVCVTLLIYNNYVPH